MKKTIFAALAAVMTMSAASSALAYDTFGQNPNQNQYIEQFHISYRDGVNFLKHHDDIIVKNWLKSDDHKAQTRDRLLDEFGEAFAYFQVYEGDTDRAVGLLDEIFEDVEIGRTWVHDQVFLDGIRDLQAKELPKGKTFQDYNGDFGAVWDTATIGNE